VRGMRPVVLLLVLAATAASVACRRHRMSADDCQVVLDRITDLELRERGFRDPALAARRKTEMRARFSSELGGCTGRRVHPEALSCVRAARSAEELSHRCLR
jgi:hypothetical protein